MVNCMAKENLVKKLIRISGEEIEAQKDQEAERKKLLEIDPDNPRIVNLKEKIIADIEDMVVREASYGLKETEYRVDYGKYHNDFNKRGYKREFIRNQDDEIFVMNSADQYTIRNILPKLMEIFRGGKVRFKGRMYSEGSSGDPEGDGCFGHDTGCRPYYYQLYTINW